MAKRRRVSKGKTTKVAKKKSAAILPHPKNESGTHQVVVDAHIPIEFSSSLGSGAEIMLASDGPSDRPQERLVPRADYIGGNPALRAELDTYYSLVGDDPETGNYRFRLDFPNGIKPTESPRVGTQGVSATGVAADFARVPLAGRSSAMSSGRATLTVVPGDWNNERNEARDYLNRIEPVLVQLLPDIEAAEQAVPDRHGIGGNNPPEPIPLDSMQLRATIQTVNVFRTQLSSDAPDFQIIRLCGLVLKRTAHEVGKLVTWSAQQAVSGVIRAAAVAAAVAALHHDLAGLVAHVERWFQILQMSF